jgi:hypothetical protein
VCRQKAGDLTKELDVVGQLRANVRALNLDDDVSSAAQHGRVHLAEARRTEGLLGELDEELAEAPAKLRFDHLDDLLEWNRIDVILQLLQLADVGLRKQIRARG